MKRIRNVLDYVTLQIVDTTLLIPHLRECLLPEQIIKCYSIEYALLIYTIKYAVVRNNLKKNT